MHSLGIVQWNSTRRDHPGNPGGVSGSGLVIISLRLILFDVINLGLIWILSQCSMFC